MKLLVIEGIDGAGKSTQIKLLSNYLHDIGYNYEYLHFPRVDTPYFGELIARFLRGELGSISEVNPWIVAMLYAGDRKDAADIIRRWLDSGSIVILDRYTYSNIAYQCAKVADEIERDRLMNWIIDLEFNHFAIPKPDMNIFLDVPFSFTEAKLQSKRNGDDRIYLRGSKDIHEESLDFQRRVREMYLRLLNVSDDFYVVDCGDDSGNILKPKQIFEKIITLIQTKQLL